MRIQVRVSIPEVGVLSISELQVPWVNGLVFEPSSFWTVGTRASSGVQVSVLQYTVFIYKTYIDVPT